MYQRYNFLCQSGVHEEDGTCSCVVLGAVPVVDVFSPDVELGQSDGVHLHRVSSLPHELQVVCGVADWKREREEELSQ